MRQSSQLVSFFPTELGWFGLAGRGRRVERLWFGHRSQQQVRAAAARDIAGESFSEEPNWYPVAQQLCADYAAGKRVDLSRIDVLLNTKTDLQRQVLLAVRGLEYGETASYGEIAERAGAPGAARAVGTVMSHNVIPLLIPCHRVTAAGGKLGGYSSPAGLEMKVRLLQMEGAGQSVRLSKPSPGRSRTKSPVRQSRSVGIRDDQT